MSAITKFKMLVSFLFVCFTTSIVAQNGSENDMGSKLYDTYKEKGVQEVLKVYEKNNSNKDYEGMAEPLNVLAYRLMQDEEDLKGAEVLLKAQIKEYPDEANPYDSYSDLLLEMDRKDEARKNIEKSLAIANKKDHVQNDLIIEAGKAKLAILDNKDKQMNFLVGNWDNETKVFQKGEEVNSAKSTNNISFDNSGSIMIVDHDMENNKPCCKRVMVYDPVKDEFDVAYMRRNQPNGIYSSKMQLKEISPDHYEMIEKYTDENDEEVEVKHDIKKKSNEVEWITYNSNDSGWEKVRTMNLKKKG
ncbi:hypothetical protein [Christiangramia sp. SM2212]|uniref:Secreted protein n=1 Tax=Christiangramia sediminicola TaxID=3073267 RepID=A0ABU1ER66_9FLAO|nr:hypothetical protein [Christiangramia sp. SM2212]MDR5590872.1 hypothetical protein [Christiangramia sp. SM2212]